MTTPTAEPTPVEIVDNDEQDVLGPHGQNSAVAWTRRNSARVGVGWRPPRTFSALRHRNFRLFWSGQLISNIGLWMQIVAQGWLVYQLTGSSLLLGVVSFIGSMPTLIFSIPAGVWIDRYPKRNILLITQSIGMLLALSQAALVISGVIQVWQVMVLSALFGMVNAIDAPARQAFVPELASRADLMNAIALNATAFNIARAIGPAIAGILVGLTGIGVAFLLNGLTYIATLIGLGLMRLPPHPPASRRMTLWRNAAEGLDYIRTHPTILAIIAMMAVSSLFALPYNTLMPIMAGEVLQVGATGYGILMSAAGVGAVVAALTLASFGNFRAKGALLTIGNIIFPLALYVLAFTRWIPLSIVSLVVAGWAMVTQGALTNTLIQSTVPDELRGRVLSVYMLVFFGLLPLGSLLSGYVAERLGAPLAITIGASVSLAFAVFIFYRAPRVRALE